MNESTHAYRATPVGDFPRSGDKPVKQRAETGTCDTCGAKLSIYNLSTTCAQCDHPKRTW